VQRGAARCIPARPSLHGGRAYAQHRQGIALHYRARTVNQSALCIASPIDRGPANSRRRDAELQNRRTAVVMILRAQAATTMTRPSAAPVPIVAERLTVRVACQRGPVGGQRCQRCGPAAVRCERLDSPGTLAGRRWRRRSANSASPGVLWRRPAPSLSSGARALGARARQHQPLPSWQLHHHCMTTETCPDTKRKEPRDRPFLAAMVCLTC
jgi:hypothetical protein